MDPSELAKRGMNGMQEGTYGQQSFPYAMCPQANGPTYFSTVDASAVKPITLPEVVDHLAREGQCIRWDAVQGAYEMLDCKMLEQKIHALRSCRGKRRVDIPEHPLTVMASYFVMMRGDQWGASGSMFRLKNDALYLPDASFALQNQSSVHEMSSPSPVGPYASFSDSYSAQPTYFCNDNKRGAEVGTKRFRPAEDTRVAASAQHGYPLAVSFSDALSKFSTQDKGDSGRKIESVQAKAKLEFDNDYRDDDREDGWGGTYSQGCGAKQTCLRLPELIDTLAKEGQVLHWDETQRLYEVIDGPAFEEKFNALRFKRGKRREEAQHRPFARMHIHFILVRGDKWGGTGSAFRPKGEPHKDQNVPENSVCANRQHRAGAEGSEPSLSATPASTGVASNIIAPESASANAPVSLGAPISADLVQINLKSANVPGGFQCTLQHFLDVTGAGDFFSRCATQGSGGDGGHPQGFVAAGHWHGNVGGNFCQFGVESDSSSMYSGFSSSASDGSPSDGSPADAMLEGGFAADKVLNERDIASIVGNMWTENSLGDQAYFFPREAGAAPFYNGAIVALVDGRLKLCPDEEEVAIYMVVSDKNAKWKGEPTPTVEEEKLGHWCAFLGQVPVYVQGTVRSGEYIGPAADGSGLGVVTALGDGPVVGIALVGKDSEGVAAVRTLCFAGFNALTPLGADFKRLFQQARELQSSMEALTRSVEACEHSISAMTATVDDRDEQLRSLRARIEVVEGIAVPRAAGGGSACGLDAAIVAEIERHRHVRTAGGWGRVMSGVLIGALMIACLALAGDRVTGVGVVKHHLAARRHGAGAGAAAGAAAGVAESAPALLSRGGAGAKQRLLAKASGSGSGVTAQGVLADGGLENVGPTGSGEAALLLQRGRSRSAAAAAKAGATADGEASLIRSGAGGEEALVEAGSRRHHTHHHHHHHKAAAAVDEVEGRIAGKQVEAAGAEAQGAEESASAAVPVQRAAGGTA